MPVHASTFPQGNFVLSGGQYRTTDDFDPYEKMDKIFFSSITITVKDGNIDYSGINPIELESGSQKFKHTVTLDIDGTYDKDTGAIVGQFSQNTVTTYERKSSAGIRTGEGESAFVGKVTGTVVDNQVVLSFEGTLSGRSSSEADSKAVDTYTNSGTPWFKKVAFGVSEWVVQEEEEMPAEESGRDSGARASDLSGQVEIACPPDLEAWDVMKMGRVIYVNCRIKTGEDSKAVISFSDMTTFTIKPESVIVIDTPPEKDSKLKLLAGNIWVNVKKMIKDGTMEVHAGQAVAGIKGTTFVLEEDGNTSTLKVIEGTVAFKSIASGEEKMVTTGELLTASPQGLSEIEKFNISDEAKTWETDIVQEQSEATKQLPVKSTLVKPIYLVLAGGIILSLLILGVVLYKIRGRSKDTL